MHTLATGDCLDSYPQRVFDVISGVAAVVSVLLTVFYITKFETLTPIEHYMFPALVIALQVISLYCCVQTLFKEDKSGRLSGHRRIPNGDGKTNKSSF